MALDSLSLKLLPFLQIIELPRENFRDMVGAGGKAFTSLLPAVIFISS